jgi:hypothetical protein
MGLQKKSPSVDGGFATEVTPEKNSLDDFLNAWISRQFPEFSTSFPAVVYNKNHAEPEFP